MKKLRDYSVGDKIKLLGAASEKLPALFICSVDQDGYRHLYRSAEHYETGLLPVGVAAGSHEATK